MANSTAKVVKKTTTSKLEKPVKSATTRPPTSDMVNAAIKNLNERGGSSLYAIKKQMAANFMIDAEKLAPFIKKYIKSAVLNGTLIQTKGVGATGSFKIPSSKAPKPKKDVKSSPSKRKVAPASSAKSKTNTKSVKKGAEVSEKKSSATAASKKVAAKKIVVASKSPLKEKKVTKVSPKKAKVVKSPTKKPMKKAGTKKN